MIKEITLKMETKGKKKNAIGIFLHNIVEENIINFLKENDVLPLIKIKGKKVVVPSRYSYGYVEYQLGDEENWKFSVCTRVLVQGLTFDFIKDIGTTKMFTLKIKFPGMYKFEFDVEEFLNSFKERFMNSN